MTFHIASFAIGILVGFGLAGLAFIGFSMIERGGGK